MVADGAEAIRDGVVLVGEDGRITAVGPAAAVPVPAGWRVLEAAVVTPGLVDAHSVVGLGGWLNQEQDQDQLDRSAPLQPDLRALDAYSSRDRLVTWIRELGVTTVHTGHAPGALVSGQTMIVKTVADDFESHVLRPFAMLACTLGDGARAPDNASPGNRSRAVAMLRQELAKARDYLRKRDADDPAKQPDPDLRLDALGAALRGEVPLLVTAHRARDLRAALRLADEFGLRIVLDGAAEAPLELDAIRTAGVPVIAHAPMMRAMGEAENATMRLGAILRDAGIPFAYQSGYESYVPKTRVVLWEAAIAAAHGLGADAALRAITIDAARLLQVDDRVGSLEVGKDGDLALYDGDPFEYTSHCIGVVIEGTVVSQAVR
ncbi:MAG: amidohydrolase family protein [Planctomycetes bacterium]|nr:amidohydrolase family protein [Planctomycetota bacterium]